MKKIALFLATKKGYTALKGLIEHGKTGNIGCVVTFNENNVQHDWQPDIAEACKYGGIPCFLWRDFRCDDEKIFQRHDIKAAVAISWRYLLPVTLNKYLSIPLIVFHDSLLPKYRGFAPTATAIICGETTLGVTAFFAEDEVDSGDIILQKKLNVNRSEYMYEIINRQSIIYAEMLLEIISMIEEKGGIEGRKQDLSESVFSVWRDMDDCRIDWNRDAEYIYNFIRALGDPYPGAFVCYNESKIIIDRSEVIEDKRFAIRDVGKIWSIRENMPEVICGSGMLRIKRAHYDNDSKDVVTFKNLRERL